MHFNALDQCLPYSWPSMKWPFTSLKNFLCSQNTFWTENWIDSSEHLIRNTSIYCASLYCASQMLHFCKFKDPPPAKTSQLLQWSGTKPTLYRQGVPILRPQLWYSTFQIDDFYHQCFHCLLVALTLSGLESFVTSLCAAFVKFSQSTDPVDSFFDIYVLALSPEHTT